MADVLVTEEGTSKGIEGARFDHSSSEAGDGLYSVDLNLAAGDTVFTTYADGYNARQWNYSYGAIVALTRTSSGNGSCCF